MNVIRSTSITTHNISTYDYWFPNPSATHGAAGPTGFIKRASSSTFAVTDSIALSTGSHGALTSLGNGCWDSDSSLWFYEVSAGTRYVSYASFSGGGGSISNRINVSTWTDVKFITIIGSNLYIIGLVSGVLRLFKYSTAGAYISDANISTVIIGIYFIAQNGYIWCIGGSGNAYRITTAGVVTTIPTNIYTLNGLISDFAETKLLVFGNNSDNTVASWGYIDSTDATYTAVGSLPGVPPPYLSSFGNFGRSGLDIGDSWIGGGPSRTNKTYGLQDSYPSSPPAIAFASITSIDANNYILWTPSGINEFSFIADDNSITPTTSYQESSVTSVTASSYNSSIHNFQFTATAGQVLRFTVDTAEDSNAQFSGFHVSSVPYISVNDITTEEPLVFTVSKTLDFTVPSTGTYNVRFQLSPAHSISSGTFKLGYKINIIAAFTCSSLGLDPEAPQIAGQPVNFVDQSAGSSSWLWDFGDSNTSTEQNPSHTYSAGGTYSVSLTVS